jgi:putative sigma-54 modulation protein
VKNSPKTKSKPVAAKVKAAPKRVKRPVDSEEARHLKLVLTSHNVTLTDAIESHIMSRIEQLEHLDPRAIDARVTIEQDHTKAVDRQFKCSVRITEPGPDLFAEDSETDLYAAIDLVTKKIEQQMRKRHGKFKSRNHSEASKSKRSRQESTI